MTTKELTKGTEAWAWWLSRIITYTGRELDSHGYNPETRDYVPQHQYLFEDTNGARFRLTNRQVAMLEKR